jgi:drug/metabolite transporter (DMT)-like permease
MRKYHPLTITKAIFCIGIILVLPFGYNDVISIHWEEFTPAIWWATLFVVVGTTFLAYLFNIIALKELSPGVVSIYIYLQPLLAACFAMMMGKDMPRWIHLVAAVLLFAGVYLTTTGVAVAKKNQIAS